MRKKQTEELNQSEFSQDCAINRVYASQIVTQHQINKMLYNEFNENLT